MNSYSSLACSTMTMSITHTYSDLFSIINGFIAALMAMVGAECLLLDLD